MKYKILSKMRMIMVMLYLPKSSHIHIYLPIGNTIGLTSSYHYLINSNWDGWDQGWIRGLGFCVDVAHVST